MPVPKLPTFELEPWQPQMTQRAFVQSSGIEMGILLRELKDAVVVTCDSAHNIFQFMVGIHDLVTTS
jgi:hypothetical protein